MKSAGPPPAQLLRSGHLELVEKLLSPADDPGPGGGTLTSSPSLAQPKLPHSPETPRRITSARGGEITGEVALSPESRAIFLPGRVPLHHAPDLARGSIQEHGDESNHRLASVYGPVGACLRVTKVSRTIPTQA
jgi:hypothetical protein